MAGKSVIRAQTAVIHSFVSLLCPGQASRSNLLRSKTDRRDNAHQTDGRWMDGRTLVSCRRRRRRDGDHGGWWRSLLAIARDAHFAQPKTATLCKRALGCHHPWVGHYKNVRPPPCSNVAEEKNGLRRRWQEGSSAQRSSGMSLLLANLSRLPPPRRCVLYFLWLLVPVLLLYSTHPLLQQ